MSCGACGADQPDDARFCSRCGTRLDQGAGDGERAPTEQSPSQVPAYALSGENPPPAAPEPRPWRQRRGAMAAAAAIVVVLGVLAVAGWQEHWPAALFGSATPKPLTWSAVQAPLPADALGSASQNASVDDVACPSVSNCVLVGDYLNSTDSGNALVETLSHGTWIPATGAVDVPIGTQDTFIALAGVACPSPGACTAVGADLGGSQDMETPLTETLSGGTWTSGKLPLPSNADTAKPAAYLSGIACPSPGTCVATGWYVDQNGDVRGLIETLSGGAWTATSAPLPAGAVLSKESSNLPTALFVVKCPAVGTCVAVGDYMDKNGNQGLIETLSGGTWTAARAPLPDDARSANPGVFLSSIACPASGTCVVPGHYYSRNGQSRNLIETLSGGTWTSAVPPLPPDAAASQKWSETQPTGLTATACEAVGTCVAIGSYTARNGAIDAVIDTQSGGTWTAARAAVPAGAAVAKQIVYFNSATCPAPGDCIAVGGYKTQNGSTQGLIEKATYRS
jgi:hypothetical protein